MRGISVREADPPPRGFGPSHLCLHRHRRLYLLLRGETTRVADEEEAGE